MEPADEQQLTKFLAITDEQLTKVLEARKIPVTSKTLTILRDGLITLNLRYVVETRRDHGTTMWNDLVELCKSLRIVGEKIEGDAGLATAMLALAKLDGSSLGTVMLAAAKGDSKAWDLRRHLIEQHRALLAAAEQASKTFSQEVRPGRPRSPDTGFLIHAYDLWAELIGRRPGIAGPAFRFAMQCAELLDLGSIVPKTEGSYKNCLTPWLRRRKHFTQKADRN